MTSRIAAIAIDAVDTRMVADFWSAVLGWHVVEDDDDGVSIGPPDASWPAIDVLAVTETKSVKNRLHFDLRAEDSSTEDELERLLSLGARRTDVGQSDDVTWVVLSDPRATSCVYFRVRLRKLTRLAVI